MNVTSEFESPVELRDRLKVFPGSKQSQKLKAVKPMQDGNNLRSCKLILQDHAIDISRDFCSGRRWCWRRLLSHGGDADYATQQHCEQSKFLLSYHFLFKTSSRLPAKPNYQVPLADAISGDALFDNVRCEPKLTVGREIVRDKPLPLSTETFSDWYDALMGNAAVG